LRCREHDSTVITNFFISFGVISPTRLGAPVPERLTNVRLGREGGKPNAPLATGILRRGLWAKKRQGDHLGSAGAGSANARTEQHPQHAVPHRFDEQNVTARRDASWSNVQLSLDDTLGRFCPIIRTPRWRPGWKSGTCCSHTAARGDIFGPHSRRIRLELKTLQDYVKSCTASATSSSSPRQMGILQLRIPAARLAVEKVSGSRTTTSSAENILQVAGMTKLGSEPESVEGRQPEQRLPEDRLKMVPTNRRAWRGTSAGGVYTTAADLMNFAVALMSKQTIESRDAREACARNSQTGATASIPDGRPERARTYGHAPALRE